MKIFSVCLHVFVKERTPSESTFSLTMISSGANIEQTGVEEPGTTLAAIGGGIGGLVLLTVIVILIVVLLRRR